MSEKKAMSLNERHQQLLLHRSSQSKNPPPGEKPQSQKVRIEGRRRLCKLSSRDDDTLDSEPNFSGITDFDSPSPPPEKIRDILDDLSSKLDFLSIEKKTRVGGAVKPLEDQQYQHSSSGYSTTTTTTATTTTPPFVNKGSEEEEGKDDNDGGPDYASASSKFSLTPDDADPNVVLESRVESLGNFSESEGDDSFVGVGNAGKREKKSNGSSSVAKFDSKKSEFIGRSSFLDDDDDCCVVLSGKDGLRQGHGGSKDKEVGNVISIDDDDGDQYSGCDLVSEEDKDSITFSGKSGTYMLPSTVAKMLYPHQRDGLRWLWSLHCQGAGGILGDDMGLGKTMQICGFLAGLFHSKLIKRALVVAPKTLLSHWIKELSAVGLAKKTREYYGASVLARDYELQYIFKDGGILLTTYDIVRNNSKSLKGAFYFKAFNDANNEDGVAWDYVILDEGHIIKNPSTQRAKSLLEIPSFHRIIISGTPIQNNLKELWALFSFCCPQLLGDKKEFKARYESAILRGNEKNASDREKRIGSTVAKELRERIQPYFLRRLKDEVFTESKETKNTGLSKKNEIIVWLRLTRCQRQLYEAFLNSELVLSSFDGSPLAAITVLKKICDHPFLLTKRAAEDILEGMETILNQDEIGAVERMALHLANEADSEVSQQMHDVSCKISFIISLLDNLIPEGHNVLIFSQTRKMLNLVQEAITLKGYMFLRLDGTTKASERQRIVNDFQDGIGAPIFLLTSQVGGLGLTLTKADRVIVVDPAWNPSTDNQSVDRAYRIGQKKDVLVYRLMTCGTIEEKIYRMQVFKGGLFRTATEQKEQTRYFSQQDLRELFSLPKQGFDVSVTQQQMHEEHDWQHVMDDSLKKHIEFLKNQGIGGVSHHSLLFSKTTPVQVVHESNELPRKKETMFLGCSSLGSSIEHNVDGAKCAYNPKDGKQWKKNDATVSPDKPTVSEIINKIHRLQQTLANKAMVSKLPDKGERIQRQIIQLHLELERIKLANRENKETIDLDDISGKLQSVLSL